ncbi:hypothetical protein J5X84_02960 [Streptosporangiaceae bacterium NEAU-GS5]|nr:hypothetical protein [Streptosporangiaceae bacterium NEAU-GS5]
MNRKVGEGLPVTPADAGEALSEERGLAGALEDHLVNWSDRTGVLVEIWALPTTDVAADIAECVLETITDALENVERHSGARQVSVAVTTGRNGLRLTVSDDGRGMVPDTAGRGIARMKANFVALGGSLSVNGVLGGGTTVSGVLPGKARTS